MPEPLTQARAAARRHGITAPVEPLRAGANHVFRAGDVVIRVAPASADVAGQVALARWLIAEGFPTAAPLTGAEAADGAQVSVWEHVSADPRRPIDFAQLGEIIARLHRVEASRLDGVVALPFCGDAEWLDIGRRLAEAGDAYDVLRRAQEALGDWRERARREPQVVCHGDVHPQNVLMRGEEVVLIDWDSICLGPPAWDHAALIPWPDRWGGPPHAYADFAHGYGADLTGDPLAGDLATLRLLAATVNIVLQPEAAAEAAKRMRLWRGDPDAPTWTAL